MFNRTKLFAALLGLSLMASPALAENPVNDKLPDPDGKPADMTKPVKVFIIMGQSNTLEFGKVKGEAGSLEHAVKTEGLYPFLVDDSGAWTTREDVRNVSVMVGRKGIYRNEWMTVAGKGKIGIEQAIGHQLGNYFDEPVMVLKSSIGNRALGWDLLPPGGERFEATEMVSADMVKKNATVTKRNKKLYDAFKVFEGLEIEGKTLEQLYDEKFEKVTDENGKEAYKVTYVMAGYKDSPDRWFKDGDPTKIAIGWYAGKQYDDDTNNAKKILADLGTYYPGATKFEVAGFLWWQGDRDSRSGALSGRYEHNLTKLIPALRKTFDAPDAKFVTASLGQAKKGDTSGAGQILTAMQNIADAQKYPEFKGDVAFVYTHPLSMGSNSGAHYGGNAKTYMNVGLSLGEAMVELFKAEE